MVVSVRGKRVAGQPVGEVRATRPSALIRLAVKTLQWLGRQLASMTGSVGGKVPAMIVRMAGAASMPLDPWSTNSGRR